MPCYKVCHVIQQQKEALVVKWDIRYCSKCSGRRPPAIRPKRHVCSSHSRSKRFDKNLLSGPGAPRQKLTSAEWGLWLSVH